MSLQTHVFRRGATYVWRKRLPLALGGSLIQVSLRTNDPLIAKRLAMIVSARAAGVIDQMQNNGLSREEAQHFLAEVIRDELHRSKTRHMNANFSGIDEERQAVFNLERALERLSALIARWCQGESINIVQEVDNMKFEGLAGDVATSVAMGMADFKASFELPANKGMNQPVWAALRKYAERDAPSPMEMQHGRYLYYLGLNAALAARGRPTPIDPDASQMAETLGNGAWAGLSRMSQPPSHPAPAPTPQPVVETEDVPEFDPSFTALVDRFLARKRAQKMSVDMVKQMQTVFEIFAEATGVSDIRKLRQSHLAKYVDIITALPATYRKSPKDRAKSLQQIIDDAPPDAKRISVTTINRNLDYLGQIITKARSEGFSNVMAIDLNSLRPKKTKRERDERAAFTHDDLQVLFRHAVWHGAKNRKVWQEPGDLIIKDGLYWSPLIAAMTGARREEIAALKAADIVNIGGIEAVSFKENANRGVKTFSSTRVVPLHPQLVALGLADHAKAQIALNGNDADLFPDLKRDKSKKFGAALDHRFRQITKSQLNGNPQNKVFHSFRHYVVTQLSRMEGVKDQTVKDIVGHAGDSVTEERYSETTPLPVMLHAISMLPWLPLPEQKT